MDVKKSPVSVKHKKDHTKENWFLFLAQGIESKMLLLLLMAFNAAAAHVLV